MSETLLLLPPMGGDDSREIEAWEPPAKSMFGGSRGPASMCLVEAASETKE